MCRFFTCFTLFHFEPSEEPGFWPTPAGRTLQVRGESSGSWSDWWSCTAELHVETRCLKTPHDKKWGRAAGRRHLKCPSQTCWCSGGGVRLDSGKAGSCLQTSVSCHVHIGWGCGQGHKTSVRTSVNLRILRYSCPRAITFNQSTYYFLIV